MPDLVPVEYDPFAGDPEGAGTAAASSAIGPALTDWWRRGGIAGSLGMTPVDQQIAQAQGQANALASTGAPLQQRVLSGLDNPLLYAAGESPLAIRAFHASPYDFTAFDN